MRHIRLLILSIAVLLSTTSWASKVYLDATQHWCCYATYAVCFSSTQETYFMSPVQGLPGVFELEIPSNITQDNFRFGASSQTFTGTMARGWIKNLGFDVVDGSDAPSYSSSRPCYSPYDDQGSRQGTWGQVPSSVTPSQVSFQRVAIRQDQFEGCTGAMSTRLHVDVTYTGTACYMKLESDLLAQPVTKNRPTSPQTFTIKPQPTVSDEHTFTLTAYDADGVTEVGTYTRTITVHIDAEASFGDTIYYNLERCTTERVTLEASLEGSRYLWSDGSTNKSITLPALADGEEVKIGCQIFSENLSIENNLMYNGGFEDNPPTGFTSSYNYAGWDPASYYSTHGGANNLYAITHNADYFWHDFAEIEPHCGDYYAIFDAGRSGYAWQAQTADNPNLKITQGEVYAFSYWVAYPNETATPCAKLKFEITYDGTTAELSEYTLSPADNEWHKAQVNWTAPATSNNITISVRNMTQVQGADGNDFCLDDIVFQKVQGPSGEMRVRTDSITVRGKSCEDPPTPDPPTPDPPTPDPPTPDPPTPPVVDTCLTDVLYAKWDDVLFVDNHEGRWKTYQWYHNDSILSGETGQYLYQPGQPFEGNYVVLLTDHSGQQWLSCPLEYAKMPRSADLNPGKPYLTAMPVRRGTTVQLRNTSAEVDIHIYSTAGLLLYETHTTAMTLDIPAGCYLMQINDLTYDRVSTLKLIMK